MAETPIAKEVSENKKLPAAQERFMVRGDSFAYADIDVTMPVGHTVDDALKPEYWALHAHKMMRPQFNSGPDWSGAIIYLRTEDHAFYAQLYVRAVRQASLEVQLIGEPTIFGPANVDTAGYEVRWNVGKRGFDVIRKSDRMLVVGGDKMRTREDAQEWIDAAKKAA